MTKIKRFYDIQWQSDKQPELDPIGEKTYRHVNRFLIDFYATTSKTGLLKRYRMEIKKGVITDIQSAPRITWTIGGYRPDGLVRQAATLHDVGYSSGGLENCNYASIICVTDSERVSISRMACDQIYRASYIYCANNAERPSKDDVRRATIGYGVLRAFGWINFGRERLNKDF